MRLPGLEHDADLSYASGSGTLSYWHSLRLPADQYCSHSSNLRGMGAEMPKALGLPTGCQTSASTGQTDRRRPDPYGVVSEAIARLRIMVRLSFHASSAMKRLSPLCPSILEGLCGVVKSALSGGIGAIGFTSGPTMVARGVWEYPDTCSGGENCAGRGARRRSPGHSTACSCIKKSRKICL